MILDVAYWESRYKSKKTGWDLGEISPPLKIYFDQLKDKNIKILIPGGGNSYEAEYLHKLNFTNVYVVDIAIAPIENLKRRLPSFPEKNLIHKDFFNLDMKFDLIIEQTFFCALSPSLRIDYVAKVNDLLEANGKLVGLLLDIRFKKNKPPFGGDKNEYVNLFKEDFLIEVMEDCYNSINARKGKELFVKLMKK